MRPFLHDFGGVARNVDAVTGSASTISRVHPKRRRLVGNLSSDGDPGH